MGINDTDLTVRIPTELKERAQDQAGRNGRTLSNYVRWLIEQDILASQPVTADRSSHGNR